MKTRFFSSLLAVAISGAIVFTGCSEPEKVKIKLTPTATVDIPSTVDRYDLAEVQSTVVTNDLAQKLSDEGFAFSDITDVRLEALELNLVTPADEDFRFCRSVSVYLVADGLQDTLIGSVSNPTRLETHPLFLFRQSSDLKEYFAKGTHSYKVVFQMRQLFDDPISVLIKPIYFVNAEKE